MRPSQSLLIKIASDVSLTDKNVCAINVQSSIDLAHLSKKVRELECIQSNYVYTEQLKSLNIACSPTLPQKFENVLFLADQFKDYNLGIFKKVLSNIAQGGVFLVGLENSLGASRFEQEFQKPYSGPILQIQKSKCRIFGTTSFDGHFLNLEALKQLETSEDFGFIFNSGDLDLGSKILAEQIQSKLFGDIYEPCSGAGALTKEILLKNKEIKSWVGIESDWQSVELSNKNCIDSRVQFLWGDVTKNEKFKLNNQKFDFILINPPFHKGQKTDSSIGLKILDSVTINLKKDGILYVVQNEFIPYRKQVSYKDKISILHKEQGFLIWQAKL